MYGPVQGIKVCAVRFVFVTCLSLDLVFSFTALVDFVITHILNSVLWCVFGWLRCSAKIFPHPVSEKLASLHSKRLHRNSRGVIFILVNMF